MEAIRSKLIAAGKGQHDIVALTTTRSQEKTNNARSHRGGGLGDDLGYTKFSSGRSTPAAEPKDRSKGAPAAAKERVPLGSTKPNATRRPPPKRVVEGDSSEDEMNLGSSQRASSPPLPSSSYKAPVPTKPKSNKVASMKSKTTTTAAARNKQGAAPASASRKNGLFGSSLDSPSSPPAKSKSRKVFSVDDDTPTPSSSQSSQPRPKPRPKYKKLADDDAKEVISVDADNKVVRPKPHPMNSLMAKEGLRKEKGKGKEKAVASDSEDDDSLSKYNPIQDLLDDRLTKGGPQKAKGKGGGEATATDVEEDDLAKSNPIQGLLNERSTSHRNFMDSLPNKRSRTTAPADPPAEDTNSAGPSSTTSRVQPFPMSLPPSRSRTEPPASKKTAPFPMSTPERSRRVDRSSPVSTGSKRSRDDSPLGKPRGYKKTRANSVSSIDSDSSEKYAPQRLFLP